ncbi:DUF3774 domain-containing protein [Cinnamomum micranthum f. kanehirae]|uniref:DUF3774 domain-containing protein n=1 Tax=Cinnamomum micranthum f. kanehirae TaxID=337451 RepID=A0A443PJH5_9MAGN|nr:DUF3774 domain-containing protein [Cinnamomum micranthum f. kanehirae]
MSYLNRVWMAATVAVVQGHTDQEFRWNSGLRSLHLGKNRVSSYGLRPFSSGSDLGRVFVAGNRDEKLRQADDSLQKAMKLVMTCWPINSRQCSQIRARFLSFQCYPFRQTGKSRSNMWQWTEVWALRSSSGCRSAVFL